jgi:RsiW-degrading membrane proteinase PrsW (M82 family)
MAGISLQTLLYALLGGMVPTFLWLWFWWSEESDGDAKPFLLILSYLGGLLGIFIILPMKPFFEALTVSPQAIGIMYATLEEVVKIVIVALIAFHHKTINDASDYTIYLVTGALGFSALENTLYLIDPIVSKVDLGTIIITGNLRFFGATVLHTISTALAGIIIGLAFHYSFLTKVLFGIIGIIAASGLHAVFNYFIMQGSRQGTVTAIAGIWIVAVIVIILFDRLKAFSQRVATLSPVNH